MNVYEHGIEALADEWHGTLQVIATTYVPAKGGLERSILSSHNMSLVEILIPLTQIRGPHQPADYFEEKDVIHCAMGMLYHLDRVITRYVFWTSNMQRINPLCDSVSGLACDPHLSFELEAFLSSARRIYEFMRKILWKHYSNSSQGRWRSIRSVLDSKLIPSEFSERLNASWKEFGSRLADYRDCLTHYEQITEQETPCMLLPYGMRWGVSLKLPANPEAQSQTHFDFAAGPEALSYCHSVACHLVGLCADLMTLDPVRQHLENKR